MFNLYLYIHIYVKINVDVHMDLHIYIYIPASSNILEISAFLVITAFSISRRFLAHPELKRHLLFFPFLETGFHFDPFSFTLPHRWPSLAPINLRRLDDIQVYDWLNMTTSMFRPSCFQLKHATTSPNTNRHWEDTVMRY